MVDRRFDSRFPRSVYGEGSEPDPRFTLANERTFLAWIRTALALIAAGVGLEALGLALQPGFRLAASLVLVVTGLGASVMAWLGWMRVETSMRLQAPLPSSTMRLPLVVGMMIAAVLVILSILFR